MKGIEPIRTNVGAAGYGENFVRGRSIRELVEHETRWGLVTRIVGGPRLGRAEAQLLDDLLVAAFSPDPRIWPLKLGWLVASYGDWWAGVSAVQVMLAESRMGPWACGAAVPTVAALTALRATHEADYEARAVAWARGRWSLGEFIWGFGVAGGAGRETDERMALIDEAVRRHGWDDRPHVRASREGAAAIHAATGRQPNMALQLAAVGLDLGLTRPQIEAVVYQFVEPQIMGNAFESSRLAPSCLREVPTEAVTYAGPAPRRSERGRSA